MVMARDLPGWQPAVIESARPAFVKSAMAGNGLAQSKTLARGSTGSSAAVRVCPHYSNSTPSPHPHLRQGYGGQATLPMNLDICWRKRATSPPAVAKAMAGKRPSPPPCGGEGEELDRGRFMGLMREFRLRRILSSNGGEGA